MDAPAAETVSQGLIDVSEIPLAQLLAMDDDSVLAHALRQLAESALSRPQDAVSAFESSI
jgi:FXSXX-COOH protein